MSYGNLISVKELNSLTSDQISDIVGIQSPGDSLEYSNQYHWSFQIIPLDNLRYSNEDGEEPDGGWEEAYIRHKKSDDENVKNGSPEYAGRQEWLKKWAEDTRIYPLYFIKENDKYRILDGYHRLAGAFFEKVSNVACFVGEKK